MKKIFLLLILIFFFISCGPHRMKCGPGKRCLVYASNQSKIKVGTQH